MKTDADFQLFVIFAWPTLLCEYVWGSEVEVKEFVSIINKGPVDALRTYELVTDQEIVDEYRANACGLILEDLLAEHA